MPQEEEEVDAEDVSIYASSANTTTHDYEFPPAAVKDEIILYDSCANLSIVRNPYLCHNVEPCNETIRVRTLYGMNNKVYKLTGVLCIGGVPMKVLIDPMADNNVVSADDRKDAHCRA